MALAVRREVILLDRCLTWPQLAEIAAGSPLALSERAAGRIRAARHVVEAIVARRVRTYGGRCATSSWIPRNCVSFPEIS